MIDAVKLFFVFLMGTYAAIVVLLYWAGSDEGVPNDGN